MAYVTQITTTKKTAKKKLKKNYEQEEEETMNFIDREEIATRAQAKPK